MLLPEPHKHPFPLILNILPKQLFQPGQGFVVPALRMEVEHGLVWEAVGCWLLAFCFLIC